MDINELLQREQISLANARSASCVPSRRAHEGLARGYGLKLKAAGFPHRSCLPTEVRDPSVATVPGGIC